MLYKKPKETLTRLMDGLASRLFDINRAINNRVRKNDFSKVKMSGGSFLPQNVQTLFADGYINIVWGAVNPTDANNYVPIIKLKSSYNTWLDGGINFMAGNSTTSISFTNDIGALGTNIGLGSGVFYVTKDGKYDSKFAHIASYGAISRIHLIPESSTSLPAYDIVIMTGNAGTSGRILVTTILQ